MPNLERIAAMEHALDNASAAAEALDAALSAYEAAQPDFAAIAQYLDSGEWLADYLADEKGRIPKDMKRGVLSQDAAYNLLTDRARLRETMRKLAEVRP